MSPLRPGATLLVATQLLLAPRLCIGQNVAPVAPWDCTAFPNPVQILKGGSDAHYRTMQLKIAEGTFSEMWQWNVSTNSLPTTRMNAHAYNVRDGIAYGLFSPATSGDDTGYLCRFSSEPNSAVCLCKTPWWSYSATITRDGTLFITKEGGANIKKLPKTQDIAYPTGSPVDVATLTTSDCAWSDTGIQGKGTGGAINMTSSGLSVEDMDAKYDCTSCYTLPLANPMWVDDDSTMQSWTPGDQSFADLIDFEYDGTTYLIGLGSRDASVQITNLDGDGGGDALGYAYSRVEFDYSGCIPDAQYDCSKRDMAGFGALYNYAGNIYASSNTGAGIFEVDSTTLKAVLNRTGDDACDFTGSHVCANVVSNKMQSAAPDAVILRWVNKAVDATQSNDGFNCKNASDPFLPGAIVEGDPHVVDGHGARFDYHGKDHSYFTFHSSANLTLNVMTELADFELHEADHPRHKHVHGSFLTQAHIVARTNKGKMVLISHVAEHAGPTNMGFANGTVDGVPFKLKPVSTNPLEKDRVIDDVALHMDYSSLHVTNAEFEVVVTPIYLHDTPWVTSPERNVQGLDHRLDVKVKLRVPEARLKVAPHGIVGQGWDGDGLAIDGEQDVYPVSGDFKTSAMGKGAIEGTPDDYEVASPFATDFKFSRFDKIEAAPRDVAKLVAEGILNTPKEVKNGGGDTAGATARNSDEL